jgi:rhombotail lipoprotein
MRSREFLMKLRNVLLGLLVTLALTGCELLTTCYFHCRASTTRSSSSLVSFLYPSGGVPPGENAIPQLNLPVRVGIAFIPGTSLGEEGPGVEAARREQMLERIRKRFADRKFVSQIVVIPDYYLRGRSGFQTLEGVQRLYGVDVLALVSYDQVTHRDQNNWSLGYLTIVGAYMLKGNEHDVVTLMDLAVVDPATRSILLRAGGTNDRHRYTTAAHEGREARESQIEGFSAATDDLIENFDQALTQFEADVRAGKANVRVATRAANASGRGGGGAFDVLSLVALATTLAFMRLRGRGFRVAAHGSGPGRGRAPPLGRASTERS